MPTVQQLADLLGVPCPPHPERELHSVNSLDNASETDLSILAADKYVSQYKLTKAGGVLAAKKIRFAKRPEIATFLVDDPDLALVKVLKLVAPPIPQPASGVDPSAVISPTAVIGDNPQIGPHVSIGHRTRIGRNARLHPGVVISDDVVIGDDCILYPNVVVRERITIGNGVIINAGSVIGTDGFGYRWDGAQHAKIPQIGTVVIEDDVEIGSCVCVDRAKFNQTRIGRGTKIDNQVQIAHNVQIGQFAIICGQV
ncbi:MAG: UDP-3-O-(3-hydroxymyristoyl)glucosamine N-acyltransferase, partial [Burkholderiales bacterium]|nr:UDP-3-O-(3-hydroxymyristoyl)glucosamine N-acyltransferase [Phycisphaerae bacterium]